MSGNHDMAEPMTEAIGPEWIQGKAFVPEISDERLADLSSRIVPLIPKDGGFWTIEPKDPRNTAYTWDPNPTKSVTFRPVRTVRTDHYCGYHAFFKPSVAEVLAQMPEDLDDVVNAFWIPFEDGRVQIYREGNGHRAETVFGFMEDQA
jgi:hypothetical protein